MKIKKLRRIHFLDDERVRILTDEAELVEFQKEGIDRIEFKVDKYPPLDAGYIFLDNVRKGGYAIVIFLEKEFEHYDFVIYYPHLCDESEKEAKKDFKKFQRWLGFVDK
ncbi:hypothetical protein EBU24_03230 [bacterium]|nr:hypothetical protein [bacterium]